MTASSPGFEDKSGVVPLTPAGLLGVFYARRTASSITVYDDDWQEMFCVANSGQADEAIGETIRVYFLGQVSGESMGRRRYQHDLLRFLGAQLLPPGEG